MNKTILGGNIGMNALPREGHILVVDDDLGIRDFLSQLLEGEGYDVRTASNGQEAMMHLRQSVPPPCRVRPSSSTISTVHQSAIPGTASWATVLRVVS